jgi:hypothetical protein
MPSRSWRELIKKVWEVDPLLCPQCHHEMRIVSRRTCRAPARNAGKANSYQLEQGMASAALTMSKPRVHLTIDRAFMELGSPAQGRDGVRGCLCARSRLGRSAVFPLGSKARCGGVALNALDGARAPLLSDVRELHRKSSGFRISTT